MLVITGGAGFIGSNLAAALEARHADDIAICDTLGNGDKWRNIAKRALVLNREPPIRLTQSLARMGRAAQGQLKQVLDSFSNRNAEEAEGVWRRDGEIDEIYNSLFRELLTYMMEDPRTIGLCTHLLFVAKNIERAGDHCTNVAETVYHMVSGGHLSAERPKADITSETAITFEQKP